MSRKIAPPRPTKPAVEGDVYWDSAMTNNAGELPVRGVERVRLADLLLDADNPRFGQQDAGGSQAELLDHLVQKFGVDDVLSSLSVNGYFEAEPMVCRRCRSSSKP